MAKVIDLYDNVASIMIFSSATEKLLFSTK